MNKWITLEIAGKEVDMSFDEAKKLYAELEPLFKEVTAPVYPQLAPITPQELRPPFDVTCKEPLTNGRYSYVDTRVVTQ